MYASMVVYLLVIIGFAFGGAKIAKAFRHRQKSVGEIFFFFAYILAFLVFGVGLITHSVQYSQALDPIDDCYIPFGGKHMISLIFYLLLFQLSLFSVWLKGRNLPPLYMVLCLIFLLAGIVLNFLIIIQMATHDTESLDAYKDNDGSWFFIPLAAMSIVAGISMVYKVITVEKQNAETRSFRNGFLNRCNEFLKQKYSLGVWALILFLPVIFVCTLILILFGQDYNSLAKVFTETTTWTFSQKMHPPPLDHTGHYLCTVSACGSPEIVKPVRIGKRHGRPLIVNRQLQIANAFEELVANFSPALHHFIRKNYDRYGYNLSRKITTKAASNATYIIMKPLEWIFLACLYLFCQKPEEKIKRQYS